MGERFGSLKPPFVLAIICRILFCVGIVIVIVQDDSDWTTKSGSDCLFHFDYLHTMRWWVLGSSLPILLLEYATYRHFTANDVTISKTRRWKQHWPFWFKFASHLLTLYAFFTWGFLMWCKVELDMTRECDDTDDFKYFRNTHWVVYGVLTTIMTLETLILITAHGFATDMRNEQNNAR
jgi:hypothetical protein